MVRPGNAGAGALRRRAVEAAREGRRRQLHCSAGLLRHETVAQCGELGWSSEPGGCGDPAGLQALHLLHEVGTKPSGRIGGRRRGAGERLPPGDGSCVRPPSLVGSPVPGADSVQSGNAAAVRGGRRPVPVRLPEVRVSRARGVGNSDAAALGRVMSRLPCRWLGEPLVPPDAFGVGRSCITSSARFGSCLRSSPDRGIASCRPSRCCWPASCTERSAGQAARKTRSRRWRAPISEARSTSHLASYRRPARDPSTPPSARRGG